MTTRRKCNALTHENLPEFVRNGIVIKNRGKRSCSECEIVLDTESYQCPCCGSKLRSRVTVSKSNRQSLEAKKRIHTRM